MATVAVVEALGAVTLLHVRVDGVPDALVRLVVPPDVEVQPDDRIAFRIRRDRLHLFDSDGGGATAAVNRFRVGLSPPGPSGLKTRRYVRIENQLSSFRRCEALQFLEPVQRDEQRRITGAGPAVFAFDEQEAAVAGDVIPVGRAHEAAGDDDRGRAELGIPTVPPGPGRPAGSARRLRARRTVPCHPPTILADDRLAVTHEPERLHR